jgi:hypothetical protein
MSAFAVSDQVRAAAHYAAASNDRGRDDRADGGRFLDHRSQPRKRQSRAVPVHRRSPHFAAACAPVDG